MEALTTWLTGKEAQQSELQGHEDPVLHSSEVTAKVGEVRSFWQCSCILVGTPGIAVKGSTSGVEATGAAEGPGRHACG